MSVAPSTSSTTSSSVAPPFVIAGGGAAPPSRVATASNAVAPSVADLAAASLDVHYVTSTAIFIPDLGPANLAAATMLARLHVESESLQKIAGATSPAGSGLLAHVFRTTGDPSLPPMVVLLDEEEAVERAGAAGPSVARVEARCVAVERIVSLRFAGSAEELRCFLSSATADAETALLLRQLVAAATTATPAPAAASGAPGSPTTEAHQMLKTMSAVLLSVLPALRLTRFNSDSTDTHCKVSSLK